MVFVLSAISPEKMHAALANVARVLKPGSGRLLFRDYAQGDLAQERHQVRGAVGGAVQEQHQELTLGSGRLLFRDYAQGDLARECHQVRGE